MNTFIIIVGWFFGSLAIIVLLLVLLETVLQIRDRTRLYISGGKGIWLTRKKTITNDGNKAVSFIFLNPFTSWFLYRASRLHPDMKLRLKRVEFMTIVMENSLIASPEKPKVVMETLVRSPEKTKEE